MSEDSTASTPQALGATVDATAGGLLRAAREASGLHIAALAVSLKVPVRKLEALEDNRLIETQDPVFVRALAGSVCRALKIDTAPVLALLPSTIKPNLHLQDNAVNTSFRPFGDRMPSPAQGLMQPIVLLVAAILIGALVLFWLPDGWVKSIRASGFGADSTAAVLPASVNTSGNTPGSGPIFPPGEMPPGVVLSPAISMASAPSSSASGLAAVAAAAAAPPQASRLAASAAPALAAVAPSSASVTMPGSGTVSSAPTVAYSPNADDWLVITAKAEVWVEALTPRGGVALRRVLQAGETVGLANAAPLRVTVGRADVASVKVRGKDLDLQANSRDNVARFEAR